MRPDGRLVDDFHFVKWERILHAFNALSPAATSSLAIGEWSDRRSNPEVAANAFDSGSRAGGRAERQGPPTRTPFPWVAGCTVARNPVGISLSRP
jgi:hypothetical protein